MSEADVARTSPQDAVAQLVEVWRKEAAGLHAIVAPQSDSQDWSAFLTHIDERNAAFQAILDLGGVETLRNPGANAAEIKRLNERAVASHTAAAAVAASLGFDPCYSDPEAPLVPGIKVPDDHPLATVSG